MYKKEELVEKWYSRFSSVSCSLALLAVIFTGCLKYNQKSMDEKIVSDLIEESYLQGALNKMNTDAMLKGYHPDFAIFYSEGETLQRLVLTDWIALVEEYKNDPQKNRSGLRSMRYEIDQVDVTNDAAFAKIKLYRNHTLVFTDYLTLLKFNGKWKIVTKIYHAHIDSPWGS